MFQIGGGVDFTLKSVRLSFLPLSLYRSWKRCVGVYIGIILCFRWEEVLISHSTQYGCPFLGLIEHMPIVCEVSCFCILYNVVYFNLKFGNGKSFTPRKASFDRVALPILGNP